MQISRLRMNRFRHVGRPVDAEAKPSSRATSRFSNINPANLCALVLCFAVLLFAAKANAQASGAGNIQGTVTDSTGAVVGNAVVSLTEASTQVTLKTKTNSAGLYAFPNINVGTYTLKVEAPNFETYVSSNNVLEVGSSDTINPVLTVGSQNIVVRVTTEGMHLQTEDPKFKQVIDNTELTEMPLNGRTMEGLVSLVGGTQNNSVGDSNGSKFPTQSGGISINGAQGNAVSWRLDGGDNIDFMGGNNGPLPFPDAIGQFSVETAALGAQDGVEAGGLVNMVTKSGTNTFHGSAFEFMRNNYIDATNFFATCTPVAPATTCTAKDTLHQNQYGFTFGGPVRIPKLYDGRNKLFAFAAFQHSHSDQASATKTAYIPTAANLAGDFSTTDPAPVASGGTGVANSCGGVAQLVDPQTGAVLPGNKYNQPGGPALPAWNSAALSLIKQFPATTDPCGFVGFAIPNITADNEFDTRVDYTINAKNNLYVRYFLDSNQIPSFYSPTNIFLTTQSGNPEIRWQSITLGWNYIISASLVNSVHITGLRRQLSRGFNPATPNASAFGIKDFQAVPAGIWINYSTSGKNHGASSGIGGGSNLLATINDDTPIDVSDDVTWVRGKHQFTFGGGFVRNELNVNNGYEANGDFTFNGQYSIASGFGDANLDLLEGAMSGFGQSKPQQNALRGSMPTLYFQDTYHASPRLTMTGGVRWQPLFFPYDYFHRGTTFNMAAFLANKTSSVYPNAPAGTFYYGDPGVSANFTSNSPLTFNPNVGFSYDLTGNGKTVLRAGAAYAYDQPNFFIQQRVQQNAPFSLLTGPNTGAQLCFTDPWLIGGTGNAGCAQTGGTDISPYPQPAVPSPANATFAQQSQYIVLQNKFQMPDTLQWTASIQKELPHGWSVQIFYTGSRTQHQIEGSGFNQAVYTPGVWGAAGTGCGPVVTTGPGATAGGTVGGGPVGSPCSVNSLNKTWLNPATNKNQTLTINTQSRLALTEANPAQGNLYSGGNGSPSLIEDNNGISNYNGVIATVQHRFSSTFNIQSNYTWSKCLNDQDPQGDISGEQYSNPLNPRVDYGPCGSDIRQNWNTNLVAKSGFPLHGITGYLINNWEVAPLLRVVTSTPVNVTQGQDISFTGNGGDRPNLVPGVPIYQKTKILSNGGKDLYAVRSWLNPAAFTDNTVYGTQGNVSRNAFRGPIYFENDANVSRIFPIHEQFSLLLRLEAYNFLNHPSFSNPGGGGPTFTTAANSFGTISGTSVNARIFQGAIKVTF